MFRSLLFTFAFLTLTAGALAQQPGITGSVVDSTGASIAGTQVKLQLDGRGPDRETFSSESGEFAFPGTPPGHWRLVFIAKGFALKTIDGELRPEETLILPPVALVVDTLNTAVNVTQTQAEVAEAQLKVEEQQRLLGILPDFFTAYDRDAAPLNTKQKAELSGRTWLDPTAFVINGVIAGVGQAQNSHKGFGQGAKGYASRYGAAFASYGTELFAEKVILPAVFKQDPRYFYKGTGSRRSRALYAITRTLVCRGDDKREQFCYSSLIGRFGGAFATNYYYPAADRDSSGVILRNSFIGIGADAIGNLFEEFVARKITSHAKH